MNGNGATPTPGPQEGLLRFLSAPGTSAAAGAAGMAMRVPAALQAFFNWMGSKSVGPDLSRSPAPGYTPVPYKRYEWSVEKPPGPSATPSAKATLPAGAAPGPSRAPATPQSRNAVLQLEQLKTAMQIEKRNQHLAELTGGRSWVIQKK